MTKEHLIKLLATKRTAQAKYSELAIMDTSGMTDEQTVDHDIQKREACYASVRADRAYDDALAGYVPAEGTFA